MSAIGSVLCDMTDNSSRTASPPLRHRQSATDPLTELARLIGQDEAFGAEARDNGGSETLFGLSVDADEPHEPYEYGEHDGPDYSKGLPDQRRGFTILLVWIGLALAGSASGLAYWKWSGGFLSTNETQAIGASTTANNTVRPPGEEKSVEAAPAAVPQASRPVAVFQGPAPTRPAELTSGESPPSSPAGAASNQPLHLNEPAPTPTALEATTLTATDGSKYIVQLSSQRSEAAAQATSRALQTKYAGLFGSLQPFIRRSDLRDRGVYYRVQIGPFPTMAEANQLCGNLKKSGADCVVQKN